jgi:hypothetical protein
MRAGAHLKNAPSTERRRRCSSKPGAFLRQAPGAFGGDRAHVLRARTPRTFLHRVFDHVALGERVVVVGAEAGAVEEHLLAVVAAHEAEAALGHQLLHPSLHLGAAGHRPHRGRAPSPRSTATAPGRRVAVAGRELLAEQRDGDHQVLHVRIRGGEQHLLVADLDHGVAKTGVLVDDVGAGLDLFHRQHGQTSLHDGGFGPGPGA